MRDMVSILCVLLALCQEVQALSYGTPEQGFAHSMTIALETYSRDHDGRTPGSWEDLEQYFTSRSIDETFYYILPTKRYAFLQQPVRLLPPHEGELIIVTRRPFRESRLYTSWYGRIREGLREPGRYIIYRSSTGSFDSRYVLEEYIQQVFRGQEDLLPTPDTERMRQHEGEARWWALVRWIGILFIPVVLLARWIYRCLCRYLLPVDATHDPSDMSGVGA